MDERALAAYIEALGAHRAETAALAADLEAELAAVIAAAEGANLDDEHDPDGSTVGFERARTQALLHDAQGRLAAIDAGLERVRCGVAPTCTGCGLAIPVERLLALPATTLCVACAAGSRSAGP